jgi:hypothetical protein
MSTQGKVQLGMKFEVQGAFIQAEMHFFANGRPEGEPVILGTLRAPACSDPQVLEHWKFAMEQAFLSSARSIGEGLGVKIGPPYLGPEIN